MTDNNNNKTATIVSGNITANVTGSSMKSGEYQSFPTSVHFLMNDKCNAKCVFCGGDYYRSTSGKTITFEKFKTMATNLHLERFRVVTLAGAGDPLLNKDLIPIIQHINHLNPNLFISLTTNGIALTKELSDTLLGQYRVGAVNISINAGSRATYERLMQVDAFDTVIANARNFNLMRMLHHSPTPLQFSIAISKINIDELPLLVKVAHEVGVASINVFYCRFYPDSIRNINIEAAKYALNKQDSLYFHQKLSDQRVIEAKNIARSLGINFSHEPLFCEPGVARPCHWTEAELMVGFDGEVYPCGGGELHFKKKVASGAYDFGNALTQKLEEFWNNDCYQALRVSCRRSGSAPIIECTECANIMKHDDIRSHLLEWQGFDVSDAATPLVSVIVPTYNRPDMLRGAIKSILAQTFQDFEIIVINDAGQDVAGIIESFDSPKISYLTHETNKGLAAARNTGIRAARGKYIAYLDDDDIFLPQHIEVLVNSLESSEYKVAYTDACRVTQRWNGITYEVAAKDYPYAYDFDYDRILSENFIPVLCIVHEKSCLDSVGMFDETLNRHEDWDLWIRMSRQFRFLHISQVTCEFSNRPDGSSMVTGSVPAFLRTFDTICSRYASLVVNRPEICQQQRACRHRILFGVYSFLTSRIVPTGDSLSTDLPRKDLINELLKTGATENEIVSAFLFSKAHAYMGNPKDALPFLQKALEWDPDNVLAHHNLVSALLSEGETEQAVEQLHTLLEANPLDPTILKLLATYYWGRDNDKAAELSSRLLTISPDDVEIADNLARYTSANDNHHVARTIVVYSLEEQRFACAQLRLVFPLKTLHPAYKMIWATKIDQRQCMSDLGAIATADILVLQRFYPRQETLPYLEMIFASMVPVVYELDDLITDVPDDHHLKPWIEGTAKLLPQILPRVDAVTVSTQQLADMVYPFNERVYVLPNMLDENVWQQGTVKNTSGPVVIGFSGSNTHRGDLAPLKAVLFRIAEKYGDLVAFKFMGDAPPEMHDLPGFSFIPFAEDYLSYARSLPQAGFDFAIVPLNDNPFNRAKSNIKWLEYSMSGIPGIYADLPPYNTCILRGKTGLLASSDPEQWFQAISLLIDNPELRRSIALQAQQDVLANHTLRTGAHRWEEVYREVIARHKARQIIQPRVSIIVPVFNQLHLTRQCLEAIRATIPLNVATEVIVVDNGSTDGSLAYLQSLGAAVRVQANEKNLGFARACNQGALAAHGEIIVFLNNDTVPQPGWLEALLSGVDCDGADIVGAKLLYPDGTIQHAGVVFSEEGLPLHVLKKSAGMSWLVNTKRFMQAVTAACMLVKKSVFIDLQGFDESFVNGYEDIDFCLRAGIKRKKILYMPNSVITHHESKTEGRENKEDENVKLFRNRWSNRVACDEFILYDELNIIEAIENDDRLYQILGTSEYALDLYWKFTNKFPHQFGAYNYLARILRERGRLEDAELILRRGELLRGRQSDAVTVSIIVPVFNGLALTRKCLDTLLATIPQGISSEIIVVDNGSRDGTGEYLQSLWNSVRTVINVENLGFARACNQGAAAAQGETLVFLNNDTIPQTGWLQPLHEAIASGVADICGARLLYPDGRCQHAGIAFDDRGLGYHIFGNFPGDATPVTERREMQAVTGACLAISKALFTALSGFDEGFRNGFEDVDLCLRAGAMGKRILYLPESVVVHHAEQSAGRKDHDLPNMQRFFGRWLGKIRCDDQELYRRFGLTSQRESDGRIIVTPILANTPDVSIVIPLYNRADCTRNCLVALERHTVADTYELILVDNGSTDATPDLLCAWQAKATILHNSDNKGFAAACNQGARAAKGKHLLFLNNDTEVTANWLPPLVATLDNDPAVAAVGSKLLFPNGTIQHAGVAIVDDRPSRDPLLARNRYVGFPADHAPANIPMRMQALTAACLLVRKDALMQAGGFDEGYWNGYEDVDLCFALARHGWQLVYQPASVVVHYESQSGAERFRAATTNIQRLHAKWLGKIQPDLVMVSATVTEKGPGMETGQIGRYQPSTTAEPAPTSAGTPYPLVPLVGQPAASPLQRLASSQRMKAIVHRYTTE